MTRILRILLAGIVLIFACTAGVSASSSLGEQLFLSAPEEHDQLVKTYLAENPLLESGEYIYGENLKVTIFEDGTLSIVSVSTQENTETNTMDFIPRIFHQLGFHKITDIYTVTRTDYSPQGNVQIKISLMGWFETGPLLPKKAHFITFKPEYISEVFNFVTMTGGDSSSAKLSGSLFVEKEGIISSYDIIAAWTDKFRYNDVISYPQISPTEGDTGIIWIRHEDDKIQITAEMSVWFSFDGKTAPKATVTDIRGISHQGNYYCTAEYIIFEDTENGQTAVLGTVTARNVHNSEDVTQYSLKAWCTKYGNRDSSTQQIY